MNMRTIAVLNQKGGVGKTTTTVNLGHALARMGKKVTLIDLDPQSHLAISLGIYAYEQSGIDQALLERVKLEELVIQVRENLQLVLAGPRLQEIEQLKAGGAHRGDLLRNVLNNSFLDQDFVFIDCPPSSGLLIANALFATQDILIPMTGEFLSLQGLSNLMATIRKFEKALNRKYCLRIVLARYLPARKIAREVVEKLRSYFPSQVLATQIRETVSLAECPGFGKTIFEYRPQSNSAADFNNLANDFLEGRVLS